MPITLFIDACSEDAAFTAVNDRELILSNLLALGFTEANPAPAFFAAGRYIGCIENHENQVDLIMYFYDSKINISKASELLGSLSSNIHTDLLMDVYNEINSDTYDLKEKYMLEFYVPKIQNETI